MMQLNIQLVEFIGLHALTLAFSYSIYMASIVVV